MTDLSRTALPRHRGFAPILAIVGILASSGTPARAAEVGIGEAGPAPESPRAALIEPTATAGANINPRPAIAQPVVPRQSNPATRGANIQAPAPHETPPSDGRGLFRGSLVSLTAACVTGGLGVISVSDGWGGLLNPDLHGRPLLIISGVAFGLTAALVTAGFVSERRYRRWLLSRPPRSALALTLHGR